MTGRTFICHNCRNEFETVRSDEEAWEEFVTDFPTQAANVLAGIDKKAEICNDCYSKFTTWIGAQFRGITP